MRLRGNDIRGQAVSGRDTRLTQVVDLLDDARNLLAEITEDGDLSDRDTNRLEAAAIFALSAIPYVQKVNRAEGQL